VVDKVETVKYIELEINVANTQDFNFQNFKSDIRSILGNAMRYNLGGNSRYRDRAYTTLKKIGQVFDEYGNCISQSFEPEHEHIYLIKEKLSLFRDTLDDLFSRNRGEALYILYGLAHDIFLQQRLYTERQNAPTIIKFSDMLKAYLPNDKHLSAHNDNDSLKNAML